MIGLRDAYRQQPTLAGIGIDPWAVDYGLLDHRGSLVGNPRHYRDPRTDAVIDTVHQRVPAADLCAVNGLQHLPFNTLHQFTAEPELTGRRALLIPDLLGYRLTGQQVAEHTNACPTGLLNATTGDWDADLLVTLQLPCSASHMSTIGRGTLTRPVYGGSLIFRSSADSSTVAFASQFAGRVRQASARDRRFAAAARTGGPLGPRPRLRDGERLGGSTDQVPTQRRVV